MINDKFENRVPSRLDEKIVHRTRDAVLITYQPYTCTYFVLNSHSDVAICLDLLNKFFKHHWKQISNSQEKIVCRKIRLIMASKIDFDLNVCPTFVGSLQNLGDIL